MAEGHDRSESRLDVPRVTIPDAVVKEVTIFGKPVKITMVHMSLFSKILIEHVAEDGSACSALTTCQKARIPEMVKQLAANLFHIPFGKTACKGKKSKK